MSCATTSWKCFNCNEIRRYCCCMTLANKDDMEHFLFLSFHSSHVLIWRMTTRVPTDVMRRSLFGKPCNKGKQCPSFSHNEKRCRSFQLCLDVIDLSVAQPDRQWCLLLPWRSQPNVYDPLNSSLKTDAHWLPPLAAALLISTPNFQWQHWFRPGAGGSLSTGRVLTFLHRQVLNKAPPKQVMYVVLHNQVHFVATFKWTARLPRGISCTTRSRRFRAVHGWFNVFWRDNWLLVPSEISGITPCTHAQSNILHIIYADKSQGIRVWCLGECVGLGLEKERNMRSSIKCNIFQCLLSQYCSLWAVFL